jgi:hypothetical protein
LSIAAAILKPSRWNPSEQPPEPENMCTTV